MQQLQACPVGIQCIACGSRGGDGLCQSIHSKLILVVIESFLSCKSLQAGCYCSPPNLHMISWLIMLQKVHRRHVGEVRRKYIDFSWADQWRSLWKGLSAPKFLCNQLFLQDLHRATSVCLGKKPLYILSYLANQNVKFYLCQFFLLSQTCLFQLELIRWSIIAVQNIASKIQFTWKR